METGKTNLGWEVKLSGFEAGDTLITIGSAVKLAVGGSGMHRETHLGPGDTARIGVDLCGAISIESADVAVTSGTADDYKQREGTNTDADSDADLRGE